MKTGASKHFNLTDFLTFILFVLVFLANFYKPYDGDLGWHLKYGEYFFQHHQILRANTFSTEMPNYQWPNSSWGVDLITYSVFSNFGFMGLTVLAALVITLTFFFFSKAARLTFWDKLFIFPLLVYLEAPLSQVSFRGQLVSLMFMGILSFILSLYKKDRPQVLALLVPLFLIWVNIHGEYLLGLGLLAVWSFFYFLRDFIKEKYDFEKINLKELFFFLLIGGLCAAAILINPFGLSALDESIHHFNNPWLKSIVEWLPLDIFSELWWKNIMLGVLMLLGIITLYFDKKLLKYLPFLALAVLLFILTINIRRYAWPAYYFALPLLKPLSSLFEPSEEVLNWKNLTFKKAGYFVGIILAIGLFAGGVYYFKSPFDQYTKFGWTAYCTEFNGCSDRAAQYLVDNNLTSNLFTFYNWGGWLIWRYPEVKPSLDGRMHLWKDSQGYSAFAAYYPLEQDLEDIDFSKYDVVLIDKDKPLYSRLLQLSDQGKWALLFRDQYAAIFLRQDAVNLEGSL
jgi:hypothetical protein